MPTAFMTAQHRVMVELYLKELAQLTGALQYKTFGAIKFQDDKEKYEQFRSEMNVIRSKLLAVSIALIELETAAMTAEYKEKWGSK